MCVTIIVVGSGSSLAIASELIARANHLSMRNGHMFLALLSQANAGGIVGHPRPSHHKQTWDLPKQNDRYAHSLRVVEEHNDRSTHTGLGIATESTLGL